MFIVFKKSHWSWSLFDEVSWSQWYREGWNVEVFVNWDWDSIRRFRPLSPFIVFERFRLLDLDPNMLRATRVLELILFSALYAICNIYVYRIHALVAGFLLVLLLKSPPLLENLQILTLSELSGLTFVVVALLLYKKIKWLSYFFLLLAVLTKEPFMFFLALPALQNKRWREGITALVISAVYLGTLYMVRKGGYYDFGIHEGSTARVVDGYLRNFYPVGLVLIASAPQIIKNLRSSKVDFQTVLGNFWSPLCTSLFSLLYASSVAFKAPGYTYHYGPSVVLFALASALALNELLKKKLMLLPSLIIMAFSTIYFSAKPLRFIEKLHQEHLVRYTLTEAIRNSGVKGPFVSNCEVDRKGLGYAADQREEGLNCMSQPRDLVLCCQGMSLIGIIDQCGEFDVLSK
ncbi:MAG TPA: hypothetical protein PLH57_04170, partial [Oligoflexia bacterium]|nr:hypothetical protein [Oligoflexia bacterium]